MALSSSSFRSFRAGACVLTLALLGACASTPRGATDARVAAAKGRAPEGAKLFHDNCASCHGERGQGLVSAPAIMGPDALAEYPTEANSASNPQLSNPGQVQTQKLTQVPGAASRDPFRTSADVYHYISTRMPMPPRRAGSLTPQEYWAILNFMLVSHGVQVPEGGVNEGNAASIPLPQ